MMRPRAGGCCTHYAGADWFALLCCCLLLLLLPLPSLAAASARCTVERGALALSVADTGVFGVSNDYQVEYCV